MPLRNDLLNPIAGENPSGQNLRYAPVYDKIKEARREDDDAAQGDWKLERKLADWPLVVKTAGETLATKSKDVQLAAWLTEALLKTQGVGGLRDGLDLLKGLIEGFWDTLYPEIEDGDAEMRAAPLDWVGGRLDRAVKDVPLTRGGYSWLAYKESRKVPTEAEAGESTPKAEAREAAVAEGKLTPEEFDKSFESSPKAYYVQLAADFDAALESLQALDELCGEKFQDVAPSFGPLRQTLDEVKQAVRIFLQKKREKEPDEPVEGADAEAVEPEAEAAWDATPVAQAGGAAPARARKPGGALSAEPADRDDAIARVVSVAKFMRGENQYDPAPYLILRGLRWGELRAAGTDIDQSLLAAPPSDLRQNLKRLSMESNWTEVLEAAERGMGMECGRGWLDLQRYVGRACYELGSGYEPIRNAVISGVRGLLADYPQLPELTLMDDTATANAETQTWLKEYVVVAPAPAEYTPTPYQADADEGSASGSGAEAAPDTFELAMQAARSGRPQEGIEMLMREMAQERNGRARFHRKVQLTQLCIGTGYEAIAVPILQELAAEIERRKLEDWESPELLAQPLALLYRCLTKADGSPEDRQKLYSWICRLDPLQAMSVTR
jgi:type VI secretion system protein ImpA